jgi:hypothetical protein
MSINSTFNLIMGITVLVISHTQKPANSHSQKPVISPRKGVGGFIEKTEWDRI